MQPFVVQSRKMQRVTVRNNALMQRFRPAAQTPSGLIFHGEITTIYQQLEITFTKLPELAAL